jgi:hypothetical protein
MPALSHMVVCRHRYLDNNQISTIANEIFAVLTALTQLYGTGLRVGCWLFVAWYSVSFALMFQRAWISLDEGVTGLLCACFDYNLQVSLAGPYHIHI